jgi:hypothetical protein
LGDSTSTGGAIAGRVAVFSPYCVARSLGTRGLRGLAGGFSAATFGAVSGTVSGAVKSSEVCTMGLELPDAAAFFSTGCETDFFALEREVAARGGAKETVLIIEINGSHRCTKSGMVSLT